MMSLISKTEAEVLKERVDKLNKPSDLELILKKNEEKKKEISKEQEMDKTPPKDVKTKEVFDEVEEEKEAKKKAVIKPMPTRKEIYAYAKKQGMTIEDKELKDYAKMPVSKLIEEIGDPRKSLT